MRYYLWQDSSWYGDEHRGARQYRKQGVMDKQRGDLLLHQAISLLAASCQMEASWNVGANGIVEDECVCPNQLKNKVKNNALKIATIIP